MHVRDPTPNKEKNDYINRQVSALSDTRDYLFAIAAFVYELTWMHVGDVLEWPPHKCQIQVFANIF